MRLKFIVVLAVVFLAVMALATPVFAHHPSEAATADSLCRDVKRGRNAFGYVVPNGDQPLSKLIAENRVGIRALKRALEMSRQAGTTGRRITGACLDDTDLVFNFEDVDSVSAVLAVFQRNLMTLKCLRSYPQERFGEKRYCSY
ncbi:MAG: hypothetical protein HYW89_01125 [Candidatus Sungiibacteriota bacterium]|uniref:Uncharacterized protein n=1 Tax=Candidatus Sungiibacteriota bacterium TaxID=2750080 RepID=A0A7T5RK16_9BACT|nr:MAG: hypothetical protein HYW89_01125 [Candidatus Sungbacteria bacterium]